jgi:heme/copper-type cytochrome/quinol oxidase subunit 2
MSGERLSRVAIVIGLIAIVIGAYAVFRPMVYPHPSYQPTTRTVTVTLVDREVWGLNYTTEDPEEEELIIGKVRRWVPNVITVFEGDTVVLTVKNKGIHVHSLVLPAFNVDTGEVSPSTGETTVNFVASQRGTFEFKCGVPFDAGTGRCDPDHDQQAGYLRVLALAIIYEEDLEEE